MRETFEDRMAETKASTEARYHGLVMRAVDGEELPNAEVPAESLVAACVAIGKRIDDFQADVNRLKARSAIAERLGKQMPAEAAEADRAMSEIVAEGRALWEKFLADRKALADRTAKVKHSAMAIRSDFEARRQAALREWEASGGGDPARWFEIPEASAPEQPAPRLGIQAMGAMVPLSGGRMPTRGKPRAEQAAAAE